MRYRRLRAGRHCPGCHSNRNCDPYPNGDCNRDRHSFGNSHPHADRDRHRNCDSDAFDCDRYCNCDAKFNFPTATATAAFTATSTPTSTGTVGLATATATKTATRTSRSLDGHSYRDEPPRRPRQPLRPSTRNCHPDRDRNRIADPNRDRHSNQDANCHRDRYLHEHTDPDCHRDAGRRAHSAMPKKLNLQASPHATASTVITIRNTGTGRLIANVGAAKPPFTEISGGSGIVIDAGASHQLTIVYSPTAKGLERSDRDNEHRCQSEEGDQGEAQGQVEVDRRPLMRVLFRWHHRERYLERHAVLRLRARRAIDAAALRP